MDKTRVVLAVLLVLCITSIVCIGIWQVNETSRVAFSRGLINGSYSQYGWRTP